MGCNFSFQDISIAPHAGNCFPLPRNECVCFIVFVKEIEHVLSSASHTPFSHGATPHWSDGVRVACVCVSGLFVPRGLSVATRLSPTSPSAPSVQPLNCHLRPCKPRRLVCVPSAAALPVWSDIQVSVRGRERVGGQGLKSTKTKWKKQKSWVAFVDFFLLLFVCLFVL